MEARTTRRSITAFPARFAAERSRRAYEAPRRGAPGFKARPEAARPAAACPGGAQGAAATLIYGRKCPVPPALGIVCAVSPCLEDRAAPKKSPLLPPRHHPAGRSTIGAGAQQPPAYPTRCQDFKGNQNPLLHRLLPAAPGSHPKTIA